MLAIINLIIGLIYISKHEEKGLVTIRQAAIYDY